MTVFLAASDESGPGDRKKGGRLAYGGYVARLDHWQKYFVPAWIECVLDTPPRIAYFHMATLSNALKANEVFGLTRYQAERKVESALRVIRNSGFLRATVSDVDVIEYDCHLSDIAVSRPTRSKTLAKPEHWIFYKYVANIVNIVVDEEPEAARIDFEFETAVGVQWELEPTK